MLGFFSGLMDEIALFDIALSGEQIAAFRGQIIVHPNKQKMAKELNDGTMDSLILLLQFEDPWQTVITGLVGSATLYTVSGVASFDDIAQLPLHVNDGPLCYPKHNLTAGSVPSSCTGFHSMRWFDFELGRFVSLSSMSARLHQEWAHLLRKLQYDRASRNIG